jgi:hypothetical protein
MPPLTPFSWAVALTAFAAILCGLFGARGLPGAWRRRVSLLALLAGVGVIARVAVAGQALQSRDPPIQPAIALVCAVAGLLAAGAAFWGLRAPERQGWRPPVLAAIAGAALAALGVASGARLPIGAGLGLLATALIAAGWPRKPNGFDPRSAVAGLGASAVLWAACLSSLV